MKRWEAVIWRRYDGLMMKRERHELEELCDLHDIVEQGPHFGTIDKIEITFVGGGAGLTVEEAETL